MTLGELARRAGQVARKIAGETYSDYRYYAPNRWHGEDPTKHTDNRRQVGQLHAGRSFWTVSHTFYTDNAQTHRTTVERDALGGILGFWRVLPEHILGNAVNILQTGQAHSLSERHRYTRRDAERLLPEVAKRTGIPEEEITIRKVV